MELLLKIIIRQQSVRFSQKETLDIPCLDFDSFLELLGFNYENKVK